jgi:multiple sugar transport system ATP-binding protein
MRTGKILQVADPMAVYDRPAEEFVGRFIGNPPMNFLRGSVAGSNGTTRVAFGDQTLPAPAAVGASGEADLLVGIRAENIQARVDASTAPGALRAETLVVEPLGSHLLVTATVGDQPLKVITRTDFPVKPGQPLWLEPELDKIRWLRSSDGVAIAE